MPQHMQYRLHWHTHGTQHTEGANSSLSFSRHLVTHPSAHSTEYLLHTSVHLLCPGPSPTSSPYIWLYFSDLLSPNMFVLSKSLFAISILHLFIPNPNLSPFLSMWTRHGLCFHTPFSHAQSSHLSSTTFYPRFSPHTTFSITILHLCPQLQQSEINFYPFSVHNVTLGHSSSAPLTHSSVQLSLGQTKRTAHCRRVALPVFCDLYLYPRVLSKRGAPRAEAQALDPLCLRSTFWEEEEATLQFHQRAIALAALCDRSMPTVTVSKAFTFYVQMSKNLVLTCNNLKVLSWTEFMKLPHGSALFIAVDLY